MKVRKNVDTIARGIFSPFDFVKKLIRRKRAPFKRKLIINPTIKQVASINLSLASITSDLIVPSRSRVVQKVEKRQGSSPAINDSIASGTSAETASADVEVTMVPLEGDFDKLWILDSTKSLAILEGTLSLTLIHGQLSLNGYQMIPGKELDVSVGLTTNYIVLKCGQVMDTRQNDLESLESRLNQCLDKETKVSTGSIINSIKSHPLFPNVTVVRVKRNEIVSISWLESVVLEPRAIYSRDPKSYFKLSSETVAIERSNQWQDVIIMEQLIENLDSSSTTLIIGPSNSGKTSFLKQLINNLASTPDRDFDSLLFIDLDIGQSELSLPGSVSFTEIDLKPDKFRPLISAPYINAMNHDYGVVKSVSVGSVDANIDPDQYMASVCQLLHVVNEYLNEDGKSTIPIFVNTMGWIRGIGQLLNIDVIRMTRPSVVIELKEVASKSELVDSFMNCSAVLNSKSTAVPIHDFSPDVIKDHATNGWSTGNGSPSMAQYKYIQWSLPACLKRDKFKAKNRCLQQMAYLVTRGPEIIWKPIQALKRFPIDTSKVYIRMVGQLPPQLIPSCLHLSWVQLLAIDDQDMTVVDVADSGTGFAIRVIESLPANLVLGAGILFLEQIDGKSRLSLMTPENGEVAQSINCILRPSGMSVPPELLCQSLQFV